jgi:hypothetical protein
VDDYGLKMAELLAESASCENCGASLPADAVLCVQCGFDLRGGPVLSRTAAPEPKKRRKKGSRLALPRPAVLAVAVGVPALIALIGVGMFLASRGGSPIAAQGTGTPAVAAVPATAGRSARPAPSRDPKDWQTSFAAFAACLSSQTVSPGPGQLKWELRSGPAGFATDSPKIQWEGVLMGRDRRGIAAVGSEAKRAFGFRFPEAALPEPFVVLFAIDEARAPELLKLSYRRVRIEGSLNPAVRAVWLDTDGDVAAVVAALPLQAGEPVYLDRAEGGIKPIYVMWFEISRFELAK